MALSPRPDLVLFGTLCDLALLEIVLGEKPAPTSISLPGYRVARAAGESYPLLVPAKGQVAKGLRLSGLSEAQIARLDYYEAPYGYTRHTLETPEGPAEIYRPGNEGPEAAEDWSLGQWQDQYGPLMREAAVEIMQEFGRVDAGLIAARVPVIRARAEQRLAARAAPSPTKLRQPHGRADVTLHQHRRPYSHFFAVEEMDVAARRFDGTMPPPSERAIFMMSDAVSVLPYDPVRDCVLLIEQFRPGAYLRGDLNPWSLEAIAGRKDPGETAEETARREALEETGLTLGALHLVGRYYSSPGGTSEYMTSYVALCDLPDGVEGVKGLESEAEDIRSMLVPFDELQEAVVTGEAENAPLLVSALWLAANRQRLRAG